MSKYLTIDFETANEDYSSICQVGVAIFEDGKCVNTWGTYINPEDYFSPINIDIHGITPEMTKDSPKFPEIYHTLNSLMEGNSVLCYGGFDIADFRQVKKKYNLPCNGIKFINVHKMVRRQWAQFSRSGYGLENICDFLGISNEKHHDAVNDAIACSKIISSILTESNESLEWWIKRINQPLYGDITQKGNPDGELFGEVILFTGGLRLSRSEAARIASFEGADVKNSFSKKITMLVVGDSDLKNVIGDISSKHKQALEHNNNGGKIKILKEDDFLTLINYNTKTT